MSDFWARKLGVRPAAPQRESTALDAWWATPPTPPAAAAPLQAPDPAPAPGAATRSAVLKAQWAKHPMHCPECGSGDYFAPSEKHAPRCYTCGYPVLHSTSGAQIPSNAGPAIPARQLEESKTNNFQPQRIIGRVGG